MIDDPEIPPTGVLADAKGRLTWRVWAPKAHRVELVLDPHGDALRLPMNAEPRGYHSITSQQESGVRYAYSLDGGPPLPDPLSRSQPEGISGPSEVLRSEDFSWEERGWSGIDRGELVFYELHVGTFTQPGTFDAVIPRLDTLKELGITAIELMPVAQFPGSRSWGYDGVFPFAVQNSYGGPPGLKRLIEACHSRGLAVILDVIYNHLGPEGNVFPEFGPYFTDRYKTDWGSAINYDGPGCDPVRATVLDNVKMWIRDYRVDGLRLDAADQIFDRGPRHILSEIAEVAHLEASKRGRPVHIFAETDQNDAPRYLRTPDRGGYGLDGHWNDDFHHAVHVVLTGESNGYYTDFAAGGSAALAKAFERVFVNDGNFSPFRDRRHGTPATEFPDDRFVAFTQNHDQVGNRLKSDRYAASLPAAAVRLAAGLLLLAPRLPLLFMGEEYGETNPFPFFCDFQEPDLIKAVRDGRKAEFAHFGWDQEPPDPLSKETRDLAVLTWSWDDPDRSRLRNLYRELLSLRRSMPGLRDPRHAKTRLFDQGTILMVERGGADVESSPRVSILFNLSGQGRPIPEEIQNAEPIFRSENRSQESSRSSVELSPFEFAIFENINI